MNTTAIEILIALNAVTIILLVWTWLAMGTTQRRMEDEFIRTRAQITVLTRLLQNNR